MLRHAVRIKMRPAPDRQPATSAASDARSGPSLMKGPATKKPCARPTSTPLNKGDTPVLYAGRFDKKFDTIGADVTGVSSIPIKGSPLIGFMTWALSALA